MTDHSPVYALELILGEPWLITKDGLENVLAIAQRANDSPEAVATRLGRPLTNSRRVTERNGTAIIPVTGPIFRRANLFTEISGATSVEVLARDIQTAIDDKSISQLLLELDSPGGQATGIAELAGLIHDSPKPITTYVGGIAASAGYWLGAAASKVIISSTALVGSIGAVMSYRPEKNAPIKIISSQSPLKQADPQTADGRAELQRVVDQLAAVFVADVARYRNTSEQHVLENFGRGGILLGASAIAVGMADSLGSLESILAGYTGASTRTVFSMTTPVKTPAADDSQPKITVEYLTANHSAVVKEISATARAEGETTERLRVSGILGHVKDKPYAQAMANAAIMGGLTASQAEAMISAMPAQITAAAPAAPAAPVAPADQASELRAAWLRDGAQVAPAANSATGAPNVPPAGSEEALKAEWEKAPELRTEFANDFELFKNYKKGISSGRVKRLARPTTE